MAAGSYASAILNILDDFAEEKARLYATERAVLNILEDAAEEKVHLGDTQRALLNIVEDFDVEKKKVELANIELRNEIVERVRAEEALRLAKAAAEGANQELEAFSYSVAHDLRAPLRSINGFSQALLDDYADRLDDTGRKYLRYACEAAQEMGDLIDGLLNLSRVTRAEILREQVDLSKAARSLIERLRIAQPDRQVDTVVQEGLVARADPRLLDVLLTNLLGNAWKFTSQRAPARIEFAAEAGERCRVYYVRDNGIGFDPRYAVKLFGVFQRLHSATAFEGTGIGLATARRIVSRHGGRIWAESELDRGATFYFTLEGEDG